MNITKITPPPQLAKYVKYFWTSVPGNDDDGGKTFKILADGLPGIIFHEFNGRAVIEEETGTKLPTSFVYGQASGSCTNSASHNFSATGISFTPYALKALFKIDACELNNRLLELNYFSDYNINDALLNAAGPGERVKILAAFLSRKTGRLSETDSIVEDSISIIANSALHISPDLLYKKYPVSARQFQRRFRQSVGLCPREYIRVIRFQKALHLLNSSPQEKLSAIAYDMGYADQSHFIREFRQFSGFTPKEYLRLNPLTAVGEKGNVYKNYFEPLRIVSYS